jgi:hypothetical protein
VRYRVEIDGEVHEATSVIVTRARMYAVLYVVAPLAALGEPLLHVCLFGRWGRSHALRFGLALVLGRLPRMGPFRSTVTTRFPCRYRSLWRRAACACCSPLE